MEKTLHFDSSSIVDQSVGDELSPVVYHATIKSLEERKVVYQSY